jgi:transposase
MDGNHKQLIQLLEQLYGNYTEQNGHIHFNKYHSKEIAQELGVDESSFSRILNPPIGKEHSAKTYQRLFTRIKTKLENKQLKEEIRTLKAETTAKIKALQNEKKEQGIRYKGVWMLVSLLALIAAAMGYQKLTNQPSGDSINNPVTECRLTANERKAISKLYATNIAHQIALEAVIFHSSYREGVYGENPEPYLEQSAIKMPNIITNTREIIQATNLKAENGEYLYKLLEDYSKNNIDTNFKSMIPLVTNKAIPTSRIRNTIFEKISTIQMYNLSRIDSVVTNTKL